MWHTPCYVLIGIVAHCSRAGCSIMFKWFQLLFLLLDLDENKPPKTLPKATFKRQRLGCAIMSKFDVFTTSSSSSVERQNQAPQNLNKFNLMFPPLLPLSLGEKTKPPKTWISLIWCFRCFFFLVNYTTKNEFLWFYHVSCIYWTWK